MRVVAAPLIALLVGMPTGTPAQSSSISTEDSSSIASPGGGESSVVGEEAEVTTAAIGQAVDSESWEKALDLIRRKAAGAADPGEEAGLRLVEARVLVRTGEFHGAVQTYRTLMDGSHLTDKARAELHDLYVQRGLFEAADRLTVAAAVPGGGDRELSAMRAYSQSTQGRYAEAARLASGGAVSGLARAQVLRANALLSLGSEEAAEQLFLQVLRESTDRNVRQVAHFGLGQVARIHGGRAVRALQDERAARLGSAPWAELDWGLALRALGRKDEARDRLEEVVASYPELDATARLALARLEEGDGQADAALEHLVDALEGRSGDFLPLARLGERLLADGREEDGIEAYRAALVLFPDFPPARDGLTRALVSRGRWDETPAPVIDEETWDMPGWTWDRLLDGDLPFFPVAADRDSVPLDDPRRVVLAFVHLRAGNAGAALGWTDGAEASHGLLAAVRAEALEQVGRTRDARDLWEAILDEGEGGPVARERLAHLVFPEEPSHALALWRDLFAKYPEFPRARLRMAETLQGAKRFDDALAAYREVEGVSWLSSGEKRRIRNALEDLEDQIRERDEATLDLER